MSPPDALGAGSRFRTDVASLLTIPRQRSTQLPERVPHPFSDAVRLLPWVGKDFSSGVDTHRLLIVGESMYSWEEAQSLKPELIGWIIAHISRRSWRYAFWTKIYRLFERPGVQPEWQAFWDAIAFHSYVQDWVGKRSRVRPSDDLWRDGAAPLTEVLEVLRPTRMLVLGVENWRRINNAAEFRVTSMSGSIHRLATADGSVAVASSYIRHPSAPGFAYVRTRPTVSALLRPDSLAAEETGY